MGTDGRLAIHGGVPVRSRLLPYGRQQLDEADIEAVVRTLRSDYLTTGPAIERFEREAADYAGTRHAVAFANGTAALHAACFAAGIGIGDEVITSPLTFAASANCVLYQGGVPVFADVDPNTYNMDPLEAERLITPRTKALLPVDYAGRPAELEAVMKLAKERDLVVIEDAAHALGASCKGRRIGSWSDMTMFSFHPVKPVTTGEGGMIVTNSDLYRDKLIQFRSHGITRDPGKLLRREGPWYYEMQFLGFNYRMTDIQAALGSSQLKKLDRYTERRSRLAAYYNEALASRQELILPQMSSEARSSWHLYVIRLDLQQLSADRRRIYEALLAENIGVNVHYIPVYRHPYYERLGYRQGLCPTAERLYEEMLTLPLHPGMTEEDAADVVRAVGKVLDYYANPRGGG